MSSGLDNAVVLAAWISTGGLVVRCVLTELRWCLALHCSAPAERPEIIRALRGPGGSR